MIRFIIVVLLILLILFILRSRSTKIGNISKKNLVLGPQRVQIGSIRVAGGMEVAITFCV